ncbi:4-galactosyl-N-acetylglucosaminide 3-alpha-L-fucosyltransferase [Sarotherodon galilaeus]
MGGGDFSPVEVTWSAARTLLTLWSFGDVGSGSGSEEISGGVGGLGSPSSSPPLSMQGDQSPLMGSVMVAAVAMVTVPLAGGAWICAVIVVARVVLGCGVAGRPCKGAGCSISTKGSLESSCIKSSLTSGCRVGSLAALPRFAGMVSACRSASFDTMIAWVCSSDSDCRRRPRFRLAQDVATSNGPLHSCMGNSNRTFRSGVLYIPSILGRSPFKTSLSFSPNSVPGSIAVRARPLSPPVPLPCVRDISLIPVVTSSDH